MCVRSRIFLATATECEPARGIRARLRTNQCNQMTAIDRLAGCLSQRDLAPSHGAGECLVHRSRLRRHIILCPSEACEITGLEKTTDRAGGQHNVLNQGSAPTETAKATIANSRTKGRRQGTSDMGVRTSQHSKRIDRRRRYDACNHQTAPGGSQNRGLKRLLGLESCHKQDVRTLLSRASDRGDEVFVAARDSSLTHERAGDVPMRSPASLKRNQVTTPIAATPVGGGGSQAAFGARAGATVLTKATSILGVLFMIGAIALGVIGKRGEASLLGGYKAPVTNTPAPAPLPGPKTTAPAATPQQQQSPAPAPAGSTPEKAPEKK